MSASRPLCLCNPLCFLVSRFGKRSSKELKIDALDFYYVDEGKTRIPSRRGDDDRVTHIYRSSQKLAGVITSWTAPGMQNFVAIGSGVSVPQIRDFAVLLG